MLEFATRHLGQVVASRFVGWDHAESLVWEIESDKHEVVFLKSHRQPGKFKQERNAYESWLPQISSPKIENQTHRVQTPNLVAVQDSAPLGLLISKVDGRIVESLVVEESTQLEIYKQAGEFLSAYHSIPFEDHDISVAEAMEQRLSSWARRAATHLKAKAIDWVRGRVKEALPKLDEMRRVPCHRDYHGRNWLVEIGDAGPAKGSNWDSVRLAVIDFEHSRPDLFFMDVERMWSGIWADRPRLADAFWKGYGRRISDVEEELLSRCSALAAMSTITWAIEHKDAEFERHGRKVLRDLMAEA